jgi:hypothetical protein
VRFGPLHPPSRVEGRRGFAARLAPAAILLFVSPAQAACHRFSVWHYPTPQRCHGMYRADVSPSGGKSGTRTGGTQVPPPAYVPLPSLADIDWGKPAELDEATLGRLMLRAKMEDR